MKRFPRADERQGDSLSRSRGSYCERRGGSKRAGVLILVLLFAAFAFAQDPLTAFEKAIDSGDPASVEGGLFSYVVANPKDARGFSLLAKLRLKQGRAGEARSLANRALQLDPGLFAAKLSLAEAQVSLGESSEARNVLERINDNEPKNDKDRLAFASVLRDAGDCGRALAAAERLTPRTRDSVALPLRAECLAGLGDLDKLRRLIPAAGRAVRSDPSAAVGVASVLSGAGLYKEAVNLLTPLTGPRSKDTKALLIAARSKTSLNDLAGAEVSLARAEKLAPNSADFLFAKAFLESRRGNTSKSVELLERALAIDPDNREMLAGYVVTALRAGSTGKAFVAARRLRELEPDSLDDLYLYGTAALQNNVLGEAETALKSYFAVRPEDSRGCIALGLTYAASPDKLTQAREQLNKCIELDPKNFEARYQLGLSYKSQGETAKAIEQIEAVVAQVPDYAAALRDLGTLYLQESEEAKARTVLEKAVRLAPNDADTHFQLSRLYNLLGETELARKHLQIFQRLKNPKKNGM